MDTHTKHCVFVKFGQSKWKHSEASYVSFDQVDDPWPGESMLVIFEDGVIFSVVVLLSATIVHDEFALPFLVYAEGRTRST